MPYATNEDLPSELRRILPPRAQDIFRETFNRAYSHYDEGAAFRIAWGAVKRRYQRAEAGWIPKLDS